MDNNINLDKFDLIVAIVNKGYTDLVMEAARKEGAKGGTIIPARGSGNEEIGKFYGIAIQSEKEVVFILTNRKITDKVLNRIYEEAGLNSNGQGIMFALPASKTAGLTASSLNLVNSKE